ncbi:cobalt-precorrin-6A reductase [Rhodosalinus sp.]|uniref:cobalt-precorrin-6A reductase n=1 Tax=Rhodosalinus sp. TaxID=2047741 RepID=UPI00397958B9
MACKLLILAGTTEATAFARAASDRGLDGIVSFAGRVERPLRQPLPQRVGGFGGAAGLACYLRAEGITHVIDATHPFAVQMSRNAVAACAETGVPLVALTRPAWSPVPGDRWISVPDIAGAVAALDRPAARVMLAVGRMHLEAFAPNEQHFYLLRLVDPPKGDLPFPRAEIIVDRGPFDMAADRALMERFRLDIVVSKNAGGSGAHAKIAAARALGLPVIMIDRPPAPPREEVHDVEAVFDWLAHCGTDLGV